MELPEGSSTVFLGVRCNEGTDLTVGSLDPELAVSMQVQKQDCQAGLGLGIGINNKFCPLGKTLLCAKVYV